MDSSSGHKDASREAEFTAHYDSPLGGITLTADGASLTGLWFDGQRYCGDTPGREHEERAIPVFNRAKRWLDVYFSGRPPEFTPPLRMNATPFRLAVWEILLTIPYGCTMTYGEIAGIIARRRGLPKMSAQAVGGAVGHNPVALIVPCHRVVGSDGSLTGYGGGMKRKIRLLALEGTDMSRFFVPSKGTAL